MNTKTLLSGAALILCASVSLSTEAKSTIGGPRNVGVPVEPRPAACALEDTRIALADDRQLDQLWNRSDTICRVPVRKRPPAWSPRA